MKVKSVARLIFQSFQSALNVKVKVLKKDGDNGMALYLSWKETDIEIHSIY